MTGELTRNNIFSCTACGFTAPVRAGAGWSNCPDCGSDEVVTAPATVETAAESEPVQGETTAEGGA